MYAKYVSVKSMTSPNAGSVRKRTPKRIFTWTVFSKCTPVGQRSFPELGDQEVDHSVAACTNTEADSGQKNQRDSLPLS